MYAIQPHKRSSNGIELVRRLAAEGDRIFTVDRARDFISQAGLKPSYLLEALHHLRRDGWIVPLRRGLYAIAPSVPGIAPIHEFEVAMALTNPAAISHWSALHHHGLTEQTPRKVFVLTTTESQIPRDRGTHRDPGRDGYRVGDTNYHFVQVKPDRFFGTEKIWVGEAHIVMTDLERTLIDGLAMLQYCGDFAEVLHALEVGRATLNVDRMVDYALRWDGAMAKRVGWSLEKQGVEPAHLERLLQVPIKGYRRLDPTGPRAGPYNRRWMIQENLPGKVRA